MPRVPPRLLAGLPLPAHAGLDRGAHRVGRGWFKARMSGDDGGSRYARKPGFESPRRPPTNPDRVIPTLQAYRLPYNSRYAQRTADPMSRRPDEDHPSDR